MHIDVFVNFDDVVRLDLGPMTSAAAGKKRS